MHLKEVDRRHGRDAVVDGAGLRSRRDEVLVRIE